MSKYDSRFFVHSDEQTDTVVLKLPHDWWSRFYEYEWASKFADKNDVVLDAACGVSHPFKFYLTEKCQAVYACDLDPRILNYDAIIEETKIIFGENAALQLTESTYIDDVHFSLANLTTLPYEDKQFDKVFCISVLEHMDQSSMYQAFHEFYRVLKDDGLLILTFDFPDIQLDVLEKIIDQSNLAFYGAVSYELPQDALYSRFHPPTLYCFRAVLKKQSNV